MQLGFHIGILLIGTLAAAVGATAQEGQPQPVLPQPALPQPVLPQPVLNEEAQRDSQADCLEPPPMVEWADYDGPFAKIVGALGRKAERTSVHAPHYRPGAVLCSLEPKEKFTLFIRDTVDPVSFASAAFSAAISPGSDPSFGQGVSGFSKRFGASVADDTAGRFFKGFLYPTLFSEDPRYYRLGHGGKGRRVLHALEHAVVGHNDEGRRIFNFSELLGTGSTVAVGYLWHPGASPGIAGGARTAGIIVGEDAGFDVLREFWPEIAHAFRLPFRDRREADAE